MSRRFKIGCALALLATFALASHTAFSQAVPISDTLSENFKDLNPTPTAVLPLTPPLFIPEVAGEATDKTFTFLGHEIDFREPIGSNLQFSDRLSISTYTVRVVSDDNPNGLPPRTEPGVVRIPPAALESFSPFVITAHSDGDVPGTVNQGSDRLTVLLGWFGPETGAIYFDGIIPEPTAEGITEPILELDIPALHFDVIESGSNVAGALGIISDYVDVSPFHIRFISTDDPGLIANLPPADGFVVENFELGGGVRYSLDFTSDTEVPEPTSMLMLGLGGFALIALCRRVR